jgi:hypothetical protein
MNPFVLSFLPLEEEAIISWGRLIDLQNTDCIYLSTSLSRDYSNSKCRAHLSNTSPWTTNGRFNYELHSSKSSSSSTEAPWKSLMCAAQFGLVISWFQGCPPIPLLPTWPSQLLLNCSRPHHLLVWYRVVAYNFIPTHASIVCTFIFIQLCVTWYHDPCLQFFESFWNMKICKLISQLLDRFKSSNQGFGKL